MKYESKKLEELVKNINKFLLKEGTGKFETIGTFVKGDPSAWSRKLPTEEQYSARSFSLEKVFQPLKTSNANFLEIEWFYDISTWEKYRKFMGSGHILKRPKPMVAGSLPLIGVDDD